MKIRKGFVSNSSSCSFVVKVKNDADRETTFEDICPYCGNTYMRTRNHILDDIDNLKRGLSEFADDVESQRLVDDYEFMMEIYPEYKYREDLDKIYVIEVSRHNTRRYDLVNEYIKNGDLELLDFNDG